VTADLFVNDRVRSNVVDGLVAKLHDHYVFPDVATAIGEAIQDALRQGQYDSLSTPDALGERLTADMQAIGNDKHLRLRWNTDQPAATGHRVPSDGHRESRREYGRLNNYGFHRVERLPGNIGYLDVRGFFPADVAGPVAVAAMTFLADTDALIIDVRKNGGGDPSGIAFLTSYLFPAEPVHLNDLYWRTDDTTHQWWTLPWVPGRRYVDKPVYVLTSSYTFSAAEEFTYNLKNLQRATIVGERTGGGAHPGGMYPVWEKFEAFIPTGRAINPYSKSNWEGTGVSPDMEVSADDALHVAQMAALKHVIAQVGEHPAWPFSKVAAEAQTALDAAEAVAHSGDGSD
jgi:hypothetical protein